MNNIIKIAGLNMEWKEFYARIYKDKLDDLGFDSKLIEHENKYYVAYSHKIFNKQNAIDALMKVVKDE